MAELDADRALALTYVSTRKRPALTALWQLDAALGAVLAGGREPLISQIKLAWWREALEKLDNAKAPSEPVLEALSADALPAGVSGRALSRLEEGWTVLLSQEPLGDTELSTYSAARGALLFRLSGLALGEQLTPAMERAGEVWALADLARHSNPIDAEAAIGRAKALLPETGGLRWPSPLRPLGMLAALAQRDLERGLGAPEPHGSPGRMLRMLRLRITGR